jgi:hypothetical protein
MSLIFARRTYRASAAGASGGRQLHNSGTVVYHKPDVVWHDETTVKRYLVDRSSTFIRWLLRRFLVRGFGNFLATTHWWPTPLPWRDDDGWSYYLSRCGFLHSSFYIGTLNGLRTEGLEAAQRERCTLIDLKC